MSTHWRWIPGMLLLGSIVALYLAMPTAAQSNPTVQITENAELGPILTDANGLTLYRFLVDDENVSNCTDGCAAVWPPLLVDDPADAVADSDVTGTLGTIPRDGQFQVTYNGLPLYFFAGNATAPADTQPGDTNGQGIGDVWFVLQNVTRFVSSDAVEVALTTNDELSDILTADSGLTLYRFLVDDENVSNCNGGCATVWPPLLVGDGVTPTAGDGVTGTLSTTTRLDGSTQVTYNGLPLYFFAGNDTASADTQPGDTNGQGIGDVWFVLQNVTRFVSSDAVEVALTTNDELSDILTADSGLTLYRFLVDDENVSNCNGGCATVWPPLLVGDGVTPTAGDGVTGTLSTTTRLDGSMQVTYNGLPLYFFAGNDTASADTQPGDTNGQGIGDVWFVLQNVTRFVSSDAVEVALTTNDELGDILTADGGLTLYRFLVDDENVSNCNGGCATVWPPLLVGDGVTPTAGDGVTGTLSTTTRLDGSTQVTYNGLPLYFFAGNATAPADTQPGDTNGQGIGDVWFVIRDNENGSDSDQGNFIYLPVIMQETS